MRVRVLGALAVADFRERARRPAYLVTLAAAVALGYLALPPAASLWVIMDAGGYRGSYNSAYAATATALAGALWLMLGGFYIVRSAIARDQHTGVGQILAATPLSSIGYLAGKFWSNLMVLASMAGVLAVTALALQLARGESTAVDPGALLLPLVLLTLPVLAVTAAAAVPFETIPVLRAGLGNIAWFFVWMITAIAGAGVPLGGLGTVAASMRQAMAAQHLHPAEFSLGFTKVDHPLHTFTWHGLEPSGGFVAARLVLTLAAVCLAALPAVWFGRFDPARARPRGVPPSRTPARRPSPCQPPRLPRARGPAQRDHLPTSRMGRRRPVHPLARARARHRQPHPPHVPGHLRPLVVRRGQPRRRRRLHGHRPRQRPPGRAIPPGDRRACPGPAHDRVHHPCDTTGQAVTVACELPPDPGPSYLGRGLGKRAEGSQLPPSGSSWSRPPERRRRASRRSSRVR